MAGLLERGIRFIIDGSGARTGAVTVNRSLDSIAARSKRASAEFKSEFDKVKRSIFNVRSALLGIGSALGFRELIRTIGGFEQAMSGVKAISGATESEFKSLNATARELGATTVFSAQEAAGGMEFLARAGFDANEIIAAIPGTLDLAAAGALDLSAAADITSNVMSGFNANASEAGRFADILAVAAANSNTNVLQLGEGMKFAAPIAAGFGVEVETAGAAIGVLSDAGLQASLAGTGLRKTMSTLGNPTKELAKFMGGLTLEGDGLVAVLKELEKNGLGTSEALEFFGERAGPAVQVLTSNIPKLEELNEKLLNSEGAAKRIAQTMQDNLPGAIKQARSAFEELILVTGDEGFLESTKQAFLDLAAALRTDKAREFAALLGGALAGAVETVSTSMKFLAEHSDAVLGTFAGIISLKVVAWFTQVTAAVVKTTKAFIVLAASNPFTAIAAAIGLTIGLVVAYRDELIEVNGHQATVGDIAVVGWQKIQDGIVGVLEKFTFLQKAHNLWISLQKTLLNFTIAWAASFIDIWKGIGESIGTFFTDVFNFITEQMTELGTAAKLASQGKFAEAGKALANVLGNEFTTTADERFAQIGKDVARNFATDFTSEFISYGTELFGDAFEGLVIEAEERAKKRLAEQKSEQGDATSGKPTGGVGGVKGEGVDGTGVGGAQNTVISSLVDRIEEERQLQEALGKSREAYERVVNEIAAKNALEQEGIAITEDSIKVVADLIEELEEMEKQTAQQEKFSGTWRDAWKEAFEEIADDAKSTVEIMKDAMTDGMDAVGKVIGDTLGKGKADWADFGKSILKIVGDVFQQLLFQEFAKGNQSTSDALMNAVKRTIGIGGGDNEEKTEDQAVGEAATKAVEGQTGQGFLATLGNLFTGLGTTLRNVFEGGASLFSNIFQGIAGLFGGGGGGGGGGTFSAIASIVTSLFGFEAGGIMSGRGPVPLQRYAFGGVASGPQLALFGEGSMNEAFVPLPDGRRIPVQMQGRSGETVIVNETINVQTPNVSSFAHSQARIRARAGAGVQSAIRGVRNGVR